MRSRSLLFLALGACWQHTGPTNDATPTPAYTLVITNANVIDNDSADAVAVTGSTITAIGDSTTLAAGCAAGCKLIDAAHGYLMPGFHDSHAHLEVAGEEASELAVMGSDTPTIVSAVTTYAVANPSATTTPWILGNGWDIAGYTTLPTHVALDGIVRPVALRDSTLHNVWANQAAINAAINAQTLDPNGTLTPDPGIVRDPTTHKPTGIFRDGAARLIEDVEPTLSEMQLQSFILAAQTESIQAGYTAMEGGPVTLAVAQAYADLDANGKLKQRAFLWAPLDPTGTDPTFQMWVDFAHSLPADGKVQIAAFKGFSDGVFGSRTAALILPYADAPGTSGTLTYPGTAGQTYLNSIVLRANQAGFPVALHAIGDAAVNQALDAFEASETTLGTSTPFNRVEHASAIQSSDLGRFAQLGVAASVQPTFMYFDSLADAVFATKLGTARLSEAFPWHSLQQTGALLVFGTDYPAGGPNEDPITGMYCAIERKFQGGAAFQPDEALDAQSALDAYTINPAKLHGLDGVLGKIAVGYQADFDLFAQDPRAAAKSLATNPPLAVVIAGVAQPLP